MSYQKGISYSFYFNNIIQAYRIHMEATFGFTSLKIFPDNCTGTEYHTCCQKTTHGTTTIKQTAAITGR